MSHEMLAGGLTHMNGRLYDPVLSRFVNKWWQTNGVRHDCSCCETELRNANGAVLHWQLNAMDAEGHLTQETPGDGTASYTTYLPANGRFNYRIDNRSGVWIDYYSQGYDDLGNINTRYHMGVGGGENLAYDALNRLTQVQCFGNAAGIDAIVYGLGGNIQSKTGVGDYHYGGDPPAPPAAAPAPMPSARQAATPTPTTSTATSPAAADAP